MFPFYFGACAVLLFDILLFLPLLMLPLGITLLLFAFALRRHFVFLSHSFCFFFIFFSSSLRSRFASFSTSFRLYFLSLIFLWFLSRLIFRLPIFWHTHYSITGKEFPQKSGWRISSTSSEYGCICANSIKLAYILFILHQSNTSQMQHFGFRV